MLKHGQKEGQSLESIVSRLQQEGQGAEMSVVVDLSKREVGTAMKLHSL